MVGGSLILFHLSGWRILASNWGAFLFCRESSQQEEQEAEVFVGIVSEPHTCECIYFLLPRILFGEVRDHFLECIDTRQCYNTSGSRG